MPKISQPCRALVGASFEFKDGNIRLGDGFCLVNVRGFGRIRAENSAEPNNFGSSKQREATDEHV